MVYLQHVAECPYLPGAKYWCPYCLREECFVVGPIQRHKLTKGHKPSKDSTLRDAVKSFFRQFGRKKDLGPRYGNCELQADPPFPKGFSELRVPGYADDKAAMNGAYLGYFEVPCAFDPFAAEICTMDRGSYVPLHGELPAWSKPSELLGAMGSRFGIELGATRSYVHHPEEIESNNTKIPIPTEKSSTTPQRSEQWLEDAQERPQSALVSPEPLWFPDSKSYSYHYHCASSSSVTDTECSPSGGGLGNVSGNSSWSVPKHTSLPSNSDSSVLREESPLGYMPPRSRHERSDLKLKIPQMLSETKEGSGLNTEAVPKQIAVLLGLQDSSRSLRLDYNKQNLADELFQHVSGLEDLWKQQLTASPVLSGMTSHLHCSPAFQDGLLVLRKIFESGAEVPRTARELFHFMHIAFACAYMSHSEDGWFPWATFYQEVLRWSLSIAELEDRSLYLRVADFLWSVPESMPRAVDVALIEDIATQSRPTDFRGRDVISDLGYDDPMSNSQQQSIPFEAAYDRLVIMKQLKDGYAMQTCARYLDGTCLSLGVL